MTHKAPFRLRVRRNDALMASTMGLAVILLGCGGGGGGNGGGGGGGNGACGSPSGSGNTVVCGRVIKDDVGGSAVAGAQVQLLNAAGATLATTSSAGDGSFNFSGANTSSGALVRVSTPVGYTLNYLKYGGALYDESRLARDNTTPCVPAVSPTVGGDKNAGNFMLFSDTGAPPPPVFQCPR